MKQQKDGNIENAIEAGKVISPSVSRAIQVIELLGFGPSSLADISRKLKIPKSTLHGIVSTMEAHGWLEIKGRRIQQGAGVFRAAIQYSRNQLLLPAFYEIGQRIVSQTGETTFLGVLDGPDVLHLARVDGTAPLRYVAQEGEHGPAHLSALGKVLLAEMPPSEVDELYGSDDKAASITLTKPSIDELIARLPMIKTQGYALDQEEFTEGLCCVAAPIQDASGYAIASIALAAPEFRFTESSESFISLVCQAAADVSVKLGYYAGD